MTPIQRPYHNWRAMSQVLVTARSMMADGITSPCAMSIMNVIASNIDDASGISVTSYQLLHEEGMVPPRTATRIIAELVKAGYLERTSGGLPNRSNTYRFGPKVQTFTEERTGGAKTPNNTPHTGKKNPLLNYA